MNGEMIPAALSSPRSLLACAPLTICGRRGFPPAPAESVSSPGRPGLAGLLETSLNKDPPWLILLCPGPVSFQKLPLMIQMGLPGQGAFSRSESPAGGF